jgi:hypothetical protein
MRGKWLLNPLTHQSRCGHQPVYVKQPMRAFERNKAEAAQRRQAEAVEVWSMIWRAIEALAANEKPARGDAEPLITGFRRFQAARGDLSLEEALELIGGRGLHDALRRAERAELLIEAWRQCLPELEAAAAARCMLNTAAKLAERARCGAPPAARDDFETYVQRALLIGGGALPGFKQLTRILLKGRMPPMANVPSAYVPAARVRRETTGEKINARSGGSIRRGRDRKCGSGADGNRGSSPAAAPSRGHSRTDR